MKEQMQKLQKLLQAQRQSLEAISQKKKGRKAIVRPPPQPIPMPVFAAPVMGGVLAPIGAPPFGMAPPNPIALQPIVLGAAPTLMPQPLMPLPFGSVPPPFGAKPPAFGAVVSTPLQVPLHQSGRRSRSRSRGRRRRSRSRSRGRRSRSRGRRRRSRDRRDDRRDAHRSDRDRDRSRRPPEPRRRSPSENAADKRRRRYGDDSGSESGSSSDG
jgi:hypothetical protein